ncbi:MAG: TRAP transporter small permease [Treponema sp.]|nr:TRAP transporter small permease [Treponema sp.]
MERVTKFFDAVYAIFMFTCKICFIAMVIITSYVVFNRYVLKQGQTWGEPVVLMCMVYMSLVSAALAIRKDSHIRMMIVDFFLPKKAVCVMRGFAQVCIFFFGMFMIIYGWRFSIQAGRNLMTGVGIRSLWLYVACPVAGLAICLMEIERVINFFDRIRRGVTLHEKTIKDEAKELVEDTIKEIEA